MMKRILSALISFVLIFSFCCSFAELNEEELYIEDWVMGEEEEDGKVIADTDGSTTITITCTGDLTIGGDNYHKRAKSSMMNWINMTAASVLPWQMSGTSLKKMISHL